MKLDPTWRTNGEEIMDQIEWQKELRQAMRQIAKTGGRRTARRNARNVLNRLLKQIWKSADEAYPPIRKDGTEIVRTRKRGVCCPICDVPLKGFVELAKHAFNLHRCSGTKSGTRKCWCGKKFFNTGRNLVAGTTGFARHLAGVGRENLKAHAVVGALGNSGAK